MGSWCSFKFRQITTTRTPNPQNGTSKRPSTHNHYPLLGHSPLPSSANARSVLASHRAGRAVAPAVGVARGGAYHRLSSTHRGNCSSDQKRRGAPLRASTGHGQATPHEERRVRAAKHAWKSCSSARMHPARPAERWLWFWPTNVNALLASPPPPSTSARELVSSQPTCSGDGHSLLPRAHRSRQRTRRMQPRTCRRLT
eukprot:534199-Prymnesium_polylepis.2